MEKETSESVKEEIKEATQELWEADEKCNHEIITTWSGIHCAKCRGWFTF